MFIASQHQAAQDLGLGRRTSRLSRAAHRIATGRTPSRRHVGLWVWLLGALLSAAPVAHAQVVDELLLTLPPGQRPVEVRASFHLLDISEINEEAETFEFSGELTLSWNDPRQAFDPVEATTDEKMYSGSFQFDELSPAWYPQVILANASGLFDSRAVLLRVKPDGTCTLTEAFDAIAKVDLDLRRYPFDLQQMEAVFHVLGYGGDEVELTASPSPLSVDQRMIRVPQWSFEGARASVRKEETRSSAGRGSSVPTAFVVTADLERESLFMVRLVIIPLILIVILSWSVFWMDRSSLGDRMSVSFVGILTAVAYQIVLSDILPKISYITLMSVFLNFSLLLMCLTVLINLIVGACDKRGRIGCGDRIDKHCRWAFPVAYALLITFDLVVIYTVF